MAAAQSSTSGSRRSGGLLQVRRARHDLATEARAGLTTFMVMAYIIFLNPRSCRRARASTRPAVGRPAGRPWSPGS